MMKLDHLADIHIKDERAKVGGLREVQTVFLATIGDVQRGNFAPPWRRPEVSFLNEAAELIGKSVDDIHYAYYTSLPPGKQIYPHVDIEPYYLKINRYQIFFDLTPEQEIIQENNKSESNSLVLFDTTVTHAFINHSKTEPWRFIVFDVFK